MKIAFDTNVLLDVLLERPPFAEAARQLWAAVETKKVEGVIAAHALTTVWYLVSEAKTPVSARGVVALVARVFGVATVDAAVVRRALELDFTDFEDAVCAAAAEAAACDLIVTRNRRHFSNSPLTAVDPITALAMVTDSGSSGVSERGGTYGGAPGRHPAARRPRRGQSQPLSRATAAGPAFSARRASSPHSRCSVADRDRPARRKATASSGLTAREQTGHAPSSAGVSPAERPFSR